jgi:hypothetical protein
MTDTPPLTDDDLSAVLDGEAPAHVVARAEADPAARARLAELRAAADFVAAPVAALPDDVVDRLVSRALDAADQAFDDRPGTAAAAIATPLDARADADAEADDDGAGAGDDGSSDGGSGDRADERTDDDVVLPLAPRRSARRAAPPTWLVAAVVAALVAVGLGLVWSGRSQDRTDTATSTAATSKSAEGAGRDSSGAGSVADGADEADGDTSSDAAGGGHGSPATTAVPPTDTQASSAGPAIDLGTFPSTAALRESLRASFPESRNAYRAEDSSSPTAVAVARCAAQVQVTLSLDDPPTASGVATVAGDRVLVYEFATRSFDDRAPTTLVSAVTVDACDPVLTFER